MFFNYLKYMDTMIHRTLHTSSGDTFCATEPLPARSRLDTVARTEAAPRPGVPPVRIAGGGRKNDEDEEARRCAEWCSWASAGSN